MLPNLLLVGWDNFITLRTPTQPTIIILHSGRENSNQSVATPG